MRLKTIHLVRAEGPTKLCGAAPAVGSWAAADAILSNWSNTAPEKGGYDKCDFTLTFEQSDGDDFEYLGRYDLKHWRCEKPSLREHLRSQALFAIGAACPDHMTEEQYRHYVETHYDESVKRFYSDLLNVPGL